MGSASVFNDTREVGVTQPDAMLGEEMCTHLKDMFILFLVSQKTNRNVQIATIGWQHVCIL